MMSKIKFKIGPAARHCLKKTSPYTTMLLDISSGMTEEDISQFKLAIQADKLATKRQICLLKHAADVLRYLDDHDYISKTCTHFLEHLLLKIGRKDLGKLIEKYNEKRKNNQCIGEKTVKKEVSQSFTKLRDLKQQGHNQMPSQQTAVKEVYWGCDSELSKDVSKEKERFSIQIFHCRSRPDGASTCSGVDSDTLSHNLFESRAFNCLRVQCDLSQGSVDSSPMSVDNSQGCSVSACSQDSLKCSISDEEKIEILREKVWKLETEDSYTDVLMSSQ